MIVAILVISLIPTFVGLIKAKTGKKEAPAHAMAEVAEKEATPLVEDLDGNIEHGA